MSFLRQPTRLCNTAQALGGGGAIACTRSMGVPPMCPTGVSPVVCFKFKQTAHGRDGHATHGQDARATCTGLRAGGALRHGLAGFTIVEILATMTFLSIVLPSIMAGMTLCLSVAGTAKMQAQAADLAQSKMAEMLAEAQWDQPILSGDFGQDLPGYKWTAQLSEYGSDGLLEQLDVTVSWRHQSKDYNVTLTTLIVIPTEVGE